jgi:hypothetical protein
VLALAAGAGAVWCQSAAAYSAASGPSAALSAAFSPERLGAPTTVSFTVNIDPPSDGAPPPLAAVTVGYPRDLGLATSGLGLEACAPATLEQDEEACPPNAKMGVGSAVVDVPFGPELVTETVSLALYAAPSSDGFVHLAILARGGEPVLASIVMTGVLEPGRLTIAVPPIASLPGAPYVSLVRMKAQIGGALTYYEHVGRRVVAYRPRGIGLPDRCPRGGWRLAAGFEFAGGRHSGASTVIACPRSRRR